MPYHLAIPHRHQNDGESIGIRTPDTRLRRPLLYPTELRAVGEKRHGWRGPHLTPGIEQRQNHAPRSPETKRARHEAEPEIIPDHRVRSREVSHPNLKPAADAA